MTIIKSKKGYDMTIILTGEEKMYDFDTYFTNKAVNIIHINEEGVVSLFKSKWAQSINNTHSDLLQPKI